MFCRPVIQFAVDLLNLQESVHTLQATQATASNTASTIKSLVGSLNERLSAEPVNVH